MKRISLVIIAAMVMAILVPSLAFAGGAPDPVPLQTALGSTYQMACQIEYQMTAINPSIFYYFGLEDQNVRCLNYWNGAYPQQVFLHRQDVVIQVAPGMKGASVVFQKATRTHGKGRHKKVETYIKATITTGPGLKVFAPMIGSYNGFYDPNVARR